jgi:hypothetical protein
MAVTHADPLQGNTGNMPEAGAPDIESVTPVTQRPPALGNRGMGLQGIGMARVSTAVTLVTPVTQKKVYAAQVWETPAVSWRCRSCYGTRRWRSVYGAVVCVRCHPPASPTLVAGWEDIPLEKTLNIHEGER